MKRFVATALALVMLLALAATAFAAEDQFVPSITYKDELEIVEVVSDIPVAEGASVDACVVVTSILQAEEKTTDITQEERDLLLEVYDAIVAGEMTLPLEGEYVIRDLLDISFEHADCRAIEEHGHKDVALKEENVTISLTFNMGVEPEAEIIVMTYIDGTWTEIVSVVNNGDGTVTCVFEDLCPVAFIVK